MKSPTTQNHHRASVILITACLFTALAGVAITKALDTHKTSAAQAAAEFVEQCRQPVTSPFKANLACVGALANDSVRYRN